MKPVMRLVRLRSSSVPCQWRMGFGGDQLKATALLALEEALQELRYRPIRRSMALRFALAYLWASSGGGREPFDDYWRALSDERMWRFSAADRALIGIYAAVEVKRDDAVMMRLWEARHREEQAKDRCG
jgi:hypothetical protein